MLILRQLIIFLFTTIQIMVLTSIWSSNWFVLIKILLSIFAFLANFTFMLFILILTY